MSNINSLGNAPANFKFTDGVSGYSAEQLNQMDISDLAAVILGFNSEIKETQFKLKFSEAQARGKELEKLGQMLSAAAQIKAVFGANDTSQTSIKGSKGSDQMGLKTSGDWTANAFNYQEINRTNGAIKPASTKAENQQLFDNLNRLADVGQQTGLLSKTDVDRLIKGEFTKGDLDGLEVKIKNQMDALGSLNTQDQMSIQKMSNQLDQLNSLMSTLMKKFSDSSSSVIRNI